MAWDATGFRIVQGDSISDEKRDFITYAGDEEIEVIEVMPKKRSVTVSRAEYVGLSQSAAASKTATSGWTITARDRMDNSNQWKVVEELTTLGEWVDQD